MQKLIVPFEMRGFQGVYNLERKVKKKATRRFKFSVFGYVPILSVIIHYVIILFIWKFYEDI